MGFLAQHFAGTPSPTDDFWYGPVPSATMSGVKLTPESAQKVSAWYRGRDILATSLAMLPLGMNQRLANGGGRDEADNHPLHDTLHRKPNPWQDSFVYRRQAMFHLIDHGNHYAFIKPGPRGFADQLWPIHPTLVTPELLDSGTIAYSVRDPKRGTSRTFSQSDIFHLRGASDDGVTGKGVLEYARDSLGLGLVLETYASKLFSRGALNGGVIEVPGPMDKEAMQLTAETWKTAMNDWHMPRVLPLGAKFTAAMMEPEKAQMILSRKFTVNDIARWLGLPPHMIGDLDRATFTNIEHQGQEFVTYSLGPWLSLWEFAINDQLVLAPLRFYAEFIRDALVRGDIATRWAAYVSGTNAGILAINEVRVKENLKKVAGGDTPREPANITGNRRATDGTPAPRKPQRPADENARAEAIAQSAAGRLIRKEVKAVQKIAVKYAAAVNEFAAAVTEFYSAHVAVVVDTLAMSEADAQAYCAGQAAQVVAGDWLIALETWQTEDYISGLAWLALEEAAA
jgi:HK97 family phage portal protein